MDPGAGNHVFYSMSNLVDMARNEKVWAQLLSNLGAVRPSKYDVNKQLRWPRLIEELSRAWSGCSETTNVRTLIKSSKSSSELKQYNENY